uniref:Uncharacterized protein n=1 Tax=Arundo donax TaxID=35708 RepID=A0A0A9AXS0_ARUDO
MNGRGPHLASGSKRPSRRIDTREKFSKSSLVP